MAQKLPCMVKISNFFYIDPVWLCLTSIQLIGIHLSIQINELRVDLLKKKKNSKNRRFLTKNVPNSQVYNYGFCEAINTVPYGEFCSKTLLSSSRNYVLCLSKFKRECPL